MATSSKQTKWIPVADTKSAAEIIIQPFAFPDSSWLGSSFVFGEFGFQASQEFSLPVSIIPPPKANYVLVLRYDDVFSGQQRRYLLFTHSKMDIHYPRYSGELIAKDFVV